MSTESPQRAPQGLAVALVAAALSGFVALSYEILWYRVYGFVSAGAPQTFGLVLGAYLLGVALGSLGSRLALREQGKAGDATQLRAVAVFVYLANLASFLVIPALAWLATRAPWQASLPLVAVAAGLLGAALPLLSHFGIPADREAGARLSYVYLANILGSAAGSLMTGFVFLDIWTLSTLARVLFVTGVILAAGLWAMSRPGRGERAWGALLAVASVAACVLATRPLFAQVYEKLYFKKQFSADKEFDETVENRHGVITTYQGMVYGGGAYDGIFNTSLRDDKNWVFRAYAIAAMHPASRRVLMIGLASGSWAQIAAHLPGLEKLTVIEINPGDLGLIRNHPEVASVLDNPKVEIVIDDGRRWLQRNPASRFDVIIMNTTWHWRAHATNLLSADFLRLARAHLEPGGLLDYNSTMSDDVLKTGITVFPFALRLYNFLAVSDAPITLDPERFRQVLLDYRLEGRRVLDPAREGDRERLEQLVRLPDSLARPPIPEGLESRESMEARLGSARVITDDNMVSEWFGHQEE